MSGQRSNSGVRNLRAMFETGSDSPSDPARGRSAGDDTTSANGSTTPRHLSTVRANFVAVEKNGQIGLKMVGGSDGPSATSKAQSSPLDPLIGNDLKASSRSPPQKGSATTHNKPEIITSSTQKLKAAPTPFITDTEDAGWKAAELPITPATRTTQTNRAIGDKSNSVQSPAKQTRPVVGNAPVAPSSKPSQTIPSPSKSTSNPTTSLSTSKTTANTPRAATRNENSSSQRQTSTQQSAPVAKSHSTKSLAPISTQRSKNDLQSKKANVSSPRTPSTSSPLDQIQAKTRNAHTKASPTKPAAKATTKSSNKSKEASESSSIATALQRNVASVSTPHKSTRSSQASPAKLKSPPVSKLNQKPPTKPEKLSASATAPTASFAAKISGDAQPQQVRPVITSNSPRQNATLKPKASRHSLPNGERQENTRPRSRVSSGSIPSRAPDEGFLARMMRPTTSSLSKTHEKLEIKHPPPPRRSNTIKPKRKSSESESSRKREGIDENRGDGQELSPSGEAREQSLPPLNETDSQNDSALIQEPGLTASAT